NWNPRRKKDAIDEFLRQKKPDNAVVVKANWRDNPWFPAVLEEERRLDLQLYPERYPHVWEGEYAKAFEGAYFARQLEQARQEGRICRVAVETIGRAMRQMHSGIWRSLTRSRRLIPGGLGDRHPHASALTGRTESFDTRHLESDPAQPGVPRRGASDAGRLLGSLNRRAAPIFSRAKNRETAWAEAPYS